ncbi:hypothetical protein BH23CHL5_BH23CHL5_15840 [soil metagenome]
MTPTRGELVEQLIEAQNRIDAVARGIEVTILESEPAVGDWPPKLIICHLADWIEEMLLAGGTTLAGGTVERHPITEFDLFNHQHVEEHHNDSWFDTSARLHRHVEEAAGMLADLDDEKMATSLILPWGGNGTVTDVFEGLVDHHQEHAGHLETWKAVRAS